MSTGQHTGNVTPVSAGTTAADSAASSSTVASPNPELRSKVVEMLASTLNNGFSELGLFPDHLSTVHAIHEWSRRLSDENARLFSDNKRLAQLIGMQNTRLASQDGGKDATNHELHTRIQEIEMSRYDVIRQNEQLAQEVMILRAEIHRLSQILMSKGMAHEVARMVPSMSGPRVMGQPVMPGTYHHSQVQKARHSQLPPLNTSYSAHSAQSAPVMQAPALPAYHAGQPPHQIVVPAQSSGRRSASGPMTATFLQDPRAMPQAYANGVSKLYSSRPGTAPTRTMQTSATIVDLTGEPDSDEEKRSAKKPRIDSAPAAPVAAVTSLAAPSTPQVQDTSAGAAPADQQVAPADEDADISLDWLNMDGPIPPEPSEDVPMGSPVQVAQQVPMDVVQQAQTLLEGPPIAGSPQTEGAQQLNQSVVGALSASADTGSSMQTDDQPTQESLNPSPEVIQQCIDENFVPVEGGNWGEGAAEGAPSSGLRVCRMCQIRYVRGLSDKAPEAFAADTRTEELARHCQQEHPKGWVVLLQRCMEDDESDEDE